MAIKATFSQGAGVLSVFDDSLDNTIVTSRDAAGNILVNGGAVAVTGGRPTVSNTALIAFVSERSPSGVEVPWALM